MWSFTDLETHKTLSTPNNARPRVLLRSDMNESSNFIGSDLLENDHSLYLEMGKIEAEGGKLLVPPYDYERKFFFDLINFLLKTKIN